MERGEEGGRGGEEENWFLMFHSTAKGNIRVKHKSTNHK